MDQSLAEIAEYVRRAQRGDREALGMIFDRLQPRIYRYLVLRISDQETAEDLTQTTFLEMIRALPRYRVQSDAKFTTWVFQIARFRLIDHYRKQGRTIPLESHHDMVDTDEMDIPDPYQHDQLETAWRTLPEKYQTILHLRYLEDLTTADIAATMNISTLNVRVLQYRALHALKRVFPPSS